MPNVKRGFERSGRETTVSVIVRMEPEERDALTEEAKACRKSVNKYVCDVLERARKRRVRHVPDP